MVTLIGTLSYPVDGIARVPRPKWNKANDYDIQRWAVSYYWRHHRSDWRDMKGAEGTSEEYYVLCCCSVSNNKHSFASDSTCIFSLVSSVCWDVFNASLSIAVSPTRHFFVLFWQPLVYVSLDISFSLLLWIVQVPANRRFTYLQSPKLSLLGLPLLLSSYTCLHRHTTCFFMLIFCTFSFVICLPLAVSCSLAI